MALIRRTPSRFFPNSLWNDFFNDEWFNNTPARANVPAVNVKENNDAFEIELVAPGWKKEDFKIEVAEEVLSISSTQKENNETQDDQGNYTRREFKLNSFKRSFRLPETVDGTKIAARYEEGILTLTLPKREVEAEKAPRQIEIA